MRKNRRAGLLGTAQRLRCTLKHTEFTAVLPENQRYSFVSLSSDPIIAMTFAAGNTIVSNTPEIILAIDASKAREMGIFPAVYSLASDVLDLPRCSESTSRTFPLKFAEELQAHFCQQWPSGSEELMVAIVTISHPTSGMRHNLEKMGLPVLSYHGLIHNRV